MDAILETRRGQRRQGARDRSSNVASARQSEESHRKQGEKLLKTTIQFQDETLQSLEENHQVVKLPTLQHFISVYKSRLYSVWPVINTHTLLNQLQYADTDSETYGMATALCAATIMQLSLEPLEDDPSITVEILVHETERIRRLFNWREHPTLDTVVTSFFLHIYRANLEERKASMTYLQEAIVLARLLGLDDESYHAFNIVPSCIDRQTLF